MFEFSMKFPAEVQPAEDGGPVNLKPTGYWTKDGKRMKGSNFSGPDGANDVHFKLKLVAVQFTKDGKPHGREIPMPKGANDVHIELTPENEQGGRLTTVLDEFRQAIDSGDSEQTAVLLAALKEMLRDKGCI